MHKMKTNSGQVVDVNETSFEFAKSLGWTEVKEQQKPIPKPATKGRKRGNSKNTD